MILIDTSAAREQGKKLIPIRDVKNNYQPMFYVEDGKSLTVKLGYDGFTFTNTCEYIDDYHFYLGTNGYHVDQFAESNERNGNVCYPCEYVTDLSLFRKLYADRSLFGEDGKLIPYRALVGFEPDRYNDPKIMLGICPQAEPDRQVVIFQLNEGEVSKEFFSIPDAWMSRLPDLPMTRHELNMVAAVFAENNRLVEHISQKEYDKIPSDYKGEYTNFDGKHPELEGKRTAFLPGHGTKLFIEDVSFVINKGKSLDQQISGAKAKAEQQKASPQEHEATPSR